MLIHVFDDTPHHYMPMREFFLTQCNVVYPQQFWVRAPINTSKKTELKSTNFKYYATNDDLLAQLSALPQTAQIIFHGLFELYIWRKLMFMPVASQSSCVFWGAELYRHNKKNRTIKQHIAQYIHQFLIFRFKRVVALNPGDAQLIRQYLKRKKVQVLPYPLIGLSKKNKVTSHKVDKTYKILIGNSAAASNEHKFALQQLAHLAAENIEIIVPLNYAGKPNYIQQVIEYGRSLFADKFTPITEMLQKSAYDNLLADVDMTVFAHQRQQGLYVAYAMLLMGKPMFLCASTSSYSNLKTLGFSVYATENLANTAFKNLAKLMQTVNTDNQKLMEQHFTEQALAPKWSLFLNELVEK